VREIERWSVDDIAVSPVYVMTRTPKVWPSATLANLLFNAPDKTQSPGLGFSPWAVLDPRLFGATVTANQGALWCDLTQYWKTYDIE
jgi:hypothetical protein